MKEKALARKARRYAHGVIAALLVKRKTLPASAVEDLLMASYYNGHQSGEVHQIDHDSRRRKDKPRTTLGEQLFKT